MSQRILGKTVVLAARTFDPNDIESDDDEQEAIITSFTISENISCYEMKFSESIGNFRHSSPNALKAIIRINSYFSNNEKSRR